MQDISVNTILDTQHSTQGYGLRWVRNERMAGTVPSYGGVSSASKPSDMTSFGQQEKFTFKDFLDMINPFHHIPVINMIYREITGDQIKPASKIMGGALFGGPIGAAGSLVDAIIERETGYDLANNTLNAIGVKEKAQRQNMLITQQKAYEDLPVALLAFTEIPLRNTEGAKTQLGNDYISRSPKRAVPIRI
ncbi:MAG: hypothetical protein OEY94_02450 [Alphaproteobacteria bacterium]|nr:hypothetical protein [Alphaproteobacteria bacterium]